ncbi:MAG: histidine kinase [Actinocatenispora sp.]
MSLYWRVFLTNAAVLVTGVLVLGASPITVGVPRSVAHGVVLATGLLGLMVLNLVLLRPTFRPLEQLTERMRRIDVLRPESSLPERGPGEVAGLVRAFNEMLDRLEQERRQSGQRAVAAQESERGRVANELHDEVGQALTVVLMSLGRLSGSVPTASRQELLQAQEVVRSTMGEVHRIARELRPELLEHLGLTSSLVSLARGFSERSGIEVNCYFTSDELGLGPDAELAMYRIAQESLTNVARHADAQAVAMSITVEDPHVVLRVVDDGRGFEQRSGRDGGLRGMRERALVTGGKISIDSRSGSGVAVQLDLPRGEAEDR